MATDKERIILEKSILGAVAGAADKLPDKQLVAFLAMKGATYNHEIMVVGRAPNGWEPGFWPKDLKTPDSIRRYSEEVFASSIVERGCPMLGMFDDWKRLTPPYNPNNSAFWRVIRDVVGRLRIADVDNNPSWPAHLTWSNLYKVAPYKGGNPGSRLCNIQLAGCQELFEVEVSNYRPKRLLLITGLNWAKDFLHVLCPNYRTMNGAYVEAVGAIQWDAMPVTKIVVAGRPENSRGHSVIQSNWVAEVTAAFG